MSSAAIYAATVFNPFTGRLDFIGDSTSGGGTGGGAVSVFDSGATVGVSTFAFPGATVTSDGQGGSSVTWNPAINSTFTVALTHGATAQLKIAHLETFTRSTFTLVNQSTTDLFNAATASAVYATRQFTAAFSSTALLGLSTQAVQSYAANAFSTFTVQIDSISATIGGVAPSSRAYASFDNGRASTSDARGDTFVNFRSSDATLFNTIISTEMQIRTDTATISNALAQRTVTGVDEGGASAATVTQFNFVGAGVTYTQSAGTGTVTVTASGGATETWGNISTRSVDMGNKYGIADSSGVQVGTGTWALLDVSTNPSAGKPLARFSTGQSLIMEVDIASIAAGVDIEFVGGRRVGKTLNDLSASSVTTANNLSIASLNSHIATRAVDMANFAIYKASGIAISTSTMPGLVTISSITHTGVNPHYIAITSGDFSDVTTDLFKVQKSSFQIGSATTTTAGPIVIAKVNELPSTIQSNLFITGGSSLSLQSGGGVNSSSYAVRGYSIVATTWTTPTVRSMETYVFRWTSGTIPANTTITLSASQMLSGATVMDAPLCTEIQINASATSDVEIASVNNLPTSFDIRNGNVTNVQGYACGVWIKTP